jgi:hypothetical protein
MADDKLKLSGALLDIEITEVKTSVVGGHKG